MSVANLTSCSIQTQPYFYWRSGQPNWWLLTLVCHTCLASWWICRSTSLSSRSHYCCPIVQWCQVFPSFFGGCLEFRSQIDSGSVSLTIYGSNLRCASTRLKDLDSISVVFFLLEAQRVLQASQRFLHLFQLSAVMFHALMFRSPSFVFQSNSN